ncbi:hypothetical protein ABZ464_13330 [Streptomyces sp. NPDC005820]|uniref:hypothetical protein n=1 Tax=Streptomyces sp. NPDC005820 TaxID=3157069 RepID=UPI0033EEF068
MHARLSTFQGSAEGVEDSVRNAHETVLPALRSVDGFRGLMVLVDRASGRQLALTLWDSEQAMESGESAANRIREDSARQSGLSVEDVQHYQVALDALHG